MLRQMAIQDTADVAAPLVMVCVWVRLTILSSYRERSIQSVTPAQDKIYVQI